MLIQRISLLIVLWITLSVPAFAAAGPKARPKLVVLLAIDQFRSDYLPRFERFFLPATLKNGKPGGFRYLMDKGAYFTNAQTLHALNVTAVGHAGMLTGALPYLHGIVANHWYDQGLGRRVYCVEDAEARILGGVTGPETGRSPRTLLVSTVGDELKNALGGKPRVVAVALKDRAAILMGGHRADLAIWYDEKQHAWTSSTYYLADGRLPDWLERWNKNDYVGKNVPLLWEKLLPESAYGLSTPIPPEALGDAKGLGKSFPHPIRGNIGAFVTSPWGNSFVFDTTLAAVRAMKLGAGAEPDLLAVSLSAFDALGHNFGPLSAEMEDATVRLDRMLSDFLGALAARVPGGLANTVLVLTGDHGVQPNPLLTEKLRLPGGPYQAQKIMDDGNAILRERFGFDSSDKPIADINETHIALDHAQLRKHGKSPVEVAQHLAAWLRTLDFVAAAYTKEDALAGRLPPTSIARKTAVSMHPHRAGDILLIARPGFLRMDAHGYAGTEHESPTVQDAAVPLIFAGAPFKPGRYAVEAHLSDLAPTLSSVLGIIPPSGSEGNVLEQALRPL